MKKKTSVKRTKSTKTKATSQKSSRKKIPIAIKPPTRLRRLSNLKPLFEIRKPEIIPAVAKGGQIVGESKFYLSPSPVHVQVQEKEIYELPAGYGDNHIIVQVRDPYWIYAYWEITHEKLNLMRQEFGNALDNAKRILRVYDITGVVFNGNNANKFFDIEANDYASNWYINVGNPGRTYCVDIGLFLRDGRFIIIARSNIVATPIDGPSWITDEEWMIVEDDFNRLYGLSVGFGIGLSSAEIRKQIREHLKRQISSGLFSMASPVKKIAKRGFWLVVNTELIVYGATEPDAQVTVQGKPIKLNKDGTFNLRFALPDGEQVIPVKAVSSDKVEERVITPIVKKKTV